MVEGFSLLTASRSTDAEWHKFESKCLLSQDFADEGGPKCSHTMWIAGVRVEKAKASGIWPTRLDLSCVQSQLTTAFQINAPILFYLCQSLLSDEGAVAKPGRARREGGQILRWIFNRLRSWFSIGCNLEPGHLLAGRGQSSWWCRNRKSALNGLLLHQLGQHQSRTSSHANSSSHHTIQFVVNDIIEISL